MYNNVNYIIYITAYPNYRCSPALFLLQVLLWFGICWSYSLTGTAIVGYLLVWFSHKCCYYGQLFAGLISITGASNCWLFDVLILLTHAAMIGCWGLISLTGAVAMIWYLLVWPFSSVLLWLVTGWFDLSHMYCHGWVLAGLTSLTCTAIVDCWLVWPLSHVLPWLIAGWFDLSHKYYHSWLPAGLTSLTCTTIVDCWLVWPLSHALP